MRHENPGIELGSDLERALPRATIVTTQFDSGAVDISVTMGDRMVVVQRIPDGRIGVSPLRDDDVAFEGHDAEFQSAKQAIACVIELMTK